MVCNPHYCLSEKNAISRSRVPSSAPFPSNCVRRPYINNRPRSLPRSPDDMLQEYLLYLGEERTVECTARMAQPPQMRVIMATIDERSPLSSPFPLQKMTFHWVLVQKSNDLSLSRSKHLLTKASFLPLSLSPSLTPNNAMLATLPDEKLVQQSLLYKIVMGKM